MRRLVLLCAIVLTISCTKAPPRPSAPAPAPAPVPDPFFVYHVEHDGETLGDIARWYTGKYGNWQILTKPVNPTLTQCCAKLKVGREVQIPRHLVIRTDPMPAPKKVVSSPTGRSKEAKSKGLPSEAVGEAPTSSDESHSGPEEEAPSPSEPAEAPPPIIGPK